MKKRLLWLMLAICNGICAEKAVIIVPVANLVGQPAKSPSQLQEIYCSRIACPSAHRDLVCKRLHQALFNEQVDIITEQNEQVQIALPNVYYVTGIKKEPQNKYWTLKEYVLPLATLDQGALDKLPAPISFVPTTSPSEFTVVTLTMPWKYQDDLTFSAGTRFVVKSKMKDAFIVYMLEPSLQTITTAKLPRNLGRLNKPLSHKKLIENYIKTLKQWAHGGADGSIPYVWGGSSFTHTYNNQWEHQEKNIDGKHCTWYEISENQMNTVLNGFDCSGLIARAAQSNGIPFFYKNTYTMAQELHPLQQQEPVETGDIIWIPGHVMVISNAKKNLIIEARGYDHGYGCVHEIPINKIFKNIETVTQLKDAFLKKTPLTRMDKSGNVRDRYGTFTILKLASVWQK